jgi:hypothetical protein
LKPKNHSSGWTHRIYTQPPTDWSKATNLGMMRAVPEVKETVNLVTLYMKASYDECSTAVKVAGSRNAILRTRDGTVLGDLFDGAGFTRGLKHRGLEFGGAACLVVRAGADQVLNRMIRLASAFFLASVIASASARWAITGFAVMLT